MDEITLLRSVLRAYRHGFAEIHDIVNDSDTRVARQVLDAMVATQHRLEKIKSVHPEMTMDPDELREREHIADVRRFA